MFFSCQLVGVVQAGIFGAGIRGKKPFYSDETGLFTWVVGLLGATLDDYGVADTPLRISKPWKPLINLFLGMQQIWIM